MKAIKKEEKNQTVLILMVVLKVLNIQILKAWKSFFVNERAYAKNQKRADTTSKESVYIPTFSQNKAVFPFKEHFPKKNLLQSRQLVPGSSLFPPVFWFAWIP